MKTLDMELFAKRLKEARQNKEIKQKELSELTGISVAMLSAYENPNAKAGKNPTLSTAYTLANALDVSIDWLCGLDILSSPSQDTEIILQVLSNMIFDTRGEARLVEEFFQSPGEIGAGYYCSTLCIEIENESFLRDFLYKTTQFRLILDKNILPPDVTETVKKSYIDKYKDIPWQIMTAVNPGNREIVG